MKIERIYIRNFRSIGDEGIELKFSQGCNTFIGENNVGKSSIFEALKKVVSVDIGQPLNWEIENWHSSDKSKILEIHFDCILDDELINQIRELLKLTITNDRFRSAFTDKIQYVFKTKQLDELPYSLLKMGILQIEDGIGYFGEIGTIQSLGIDWLDLSKEINGLPHKDVKIVFEKFIKKKNLNVNPRISFHLNIPKMVLALIRQNLIFIDEFREKPQKKLSSSIVASNGRDLASVLSILKNSRLKQKEKYEQIRSKFHTLFPTLTIEVINEKEEVSIYTAKGSIESTTNFLGASVLETLLILTHVIAYEDKALCIDSPELHLHPHLQRRLSSVLSEYPKTQMLIITQSPYFVHLSQNDRIVRFIQKNGQTKIINPLLENFSADEYIKLDQILDNDVKELFFAQKVVLVEGPTEVGALPIFLSSQDFNPDDRGISIINIGGKYNFKIFSKICEAFQFPYYIIADNDARDLINELRDDEYPNKKGIVLPIDFEALLPEELKKDAKTQVGMSKPRQGKYIAQRIVQLDISLHTEIQQIIKDIKIL